MLIYSNFVLLLFFIGTLNAAKKRLVLHSEVDVVAKIQHLEQRIFDLEASNADLKTKLLTSSVGGTTYIRWGKTVCPGNGTDLVYKGYMAGSEYTQTGDGTNHLCLPEDPTWGAFQDGFHNPEYRAHAYGAEYEIGVHGDYSPFSQALLNHDAPCAVCRTTRSSSIMIPGRTNCYSGWILEYSGYLVSTWSDAAAPAEYVCLDGDAESMIHDNIDTNGHVLYLVDVVCGTLPCPPYVDGRELACVVCSK